MTLTEDEGESSSNSNVSQRGEYEGVDSDLGEFLRSQDEVEDSHEINSDSDTPTYRLRHVDTASLKRMLGDVRVGDLASQKITTEIHRRARLASEWPGGASSDAPREESGNEEYPPSGC